MIKKQVLNIGDKVAIAKLPEPELTEKFYGLHGVITKIEFNSVLVNSKKWTKETGIKQDFEFEEWFNKDFVYKDNKTTRYIFEPESEPFLTKDQRREIEKKRLEDRQKAIHDAINHKA